MAKDNNETLLIRIDERQKEMSKKIDGIDEKMKCFVINDDDYLDIKGKIKTLWDERNKLIGWMMGAGLVGGVTGSFLKNIVSTVFANIK